MRSKRKSREHHKYGHLWSQVLVSANDQNVLDAQAWCIDMIDGRPYVVGKGQINNRTVKRYLHRVIMNPPLGVEVDHINGNTLDNRRCNLRFATRAEQNYNRGPRRGLSSKYKGVHWYKRDQKWQSQIKKGQKRVHLGYFDDEIKAARTYDKAARILFKEFARLNFPEGDESCIA